MAAAAAAAKAAWHQHLSNIMARRDGVSWRQRRKASAENDESGENQRHNSINKYRIGSSMASAA